MVVTQFRLPLFLEDHPRELVFYPLERKTEQSCAKYRESQPWNVSPKCVNKLIELMIRHDSAISRFAAFLVTRHCREAAWRSYTRSLVTYFDVMTGIAKNGLPA